MSLNLSGFLLASQTGMFKPHILSLPTSFSGRVGNTERGQVLPGWLSGSLKGLGNACPLQSLKASIHDSVAPGIPSPGPFFLWGLRESAFLLWLTCTLALQPLENSTAVFLGIAVRGCS